MRLCGTATYGHFLHGAVLHYGLPCKFFKLDLGKGVLCGIVNILGAKCDQFEFYRMFLSREIDIKTVIQKLYKNAYIYMTGTSEITNIGRDQLLKCLGLAYAPFQPPSRMFKM